MLLSDEFAIGRINAREAVEQARDIERARVVRAEKKWRRAARRAASVALAGAPAGAPAAAPDAVTGGVPETLIDDQHRQLQPAGR